MHRLNVLLEYIRRGEELSVCHDGKIRLYEGGKVVLEIEDLLELPKDTEILIGVDDIDRDELYESYGLVAGVEKLKKNYAHGVFFDNFKVEWRQNENTKI